MITVSSKVSLNDLAIEIFAKNKSILSMTEGISIDLLNTENCKGGESMGYGGLQAIQSLVEEGLIRTEVKGVQLFAFATRYGMNAMTEIVKAFEARKLEESNEFQKAIEMLSFS